MDAERLDSYSKYIADPAINALRILDDLKGTLLVQDFDMSDWEKMISPLDGANTIIPLVSTNIIKPAEKDAGERGVEKIDALFQAMQMCLHPQLSKLLSEGFNIPDNDILMIAATHIGVVEASELYQIADQKDKQRLSFMLYISPVHRQKYWVLKPPPLFWP